MLAIGRASTFEQTLAGLQAQHRQLPVTGVTETAGGVTVGVLKKLAERGELKDGEKVVVYITGEGLKTLDANRDSFALTEIDPNPDSFESHFGQEVVA